ncbi:RloB-like protein [Amycolatopsis lurida]|uniref:RloB family protein n=1 Tax=Amycolatopsis lurida TaxID=31959 RepID=UPI00089C44EA|nr:RloB family protein [Amycolatopsis lurida]SEE01058.1 RloB-like protein [Amycolatopsis lurida]
MCEGKKTEHQYFSRIAAFFRASSVNVATCDIEGMGKDPVSVVKRAIEKRDKAAKNVDEKYSQVWCVVDVDEHKNLEDALLLAKQNRIGVVVSNPCFEIWALWHYEDHNAHITTKAVQRKLKRWIPEYDKDLPGNFPYANCDEAKKRAVARQKNTEGSISQNPGSAAWLVVDAVKRAKSFNFKQRR